LTRTGSLVLVLPLVLRRFADTEVAAWYLFMGMIGLSAFADFGFRGTFVRLIAFGAGGATDIDVQRGTERTAAAPANWELIERLVSMMRRIYAVTSSSIAVLLATVGTAAMLRPLSQVEHAMEAWCAWALICATAAVEFQGRVYKNYLEGMNHVAMARRVETLTKLGAILSSFLVMLIVPSLLNLVVANRAWAFLNVLRDRFLARHVEEGRWMAMRRFPFDRPFFDKVWRPAWRSGVAGLLSNGLSSLTGVFYAQFGSSASLASYLFGLKLMSEIRNVTYAPLYSKLPLLGRLRAQSDVRSVVRVARRGINTSYAVFVLGVVSVGILGAPILTLIGSRTAFVAPTLWWLLAIAFFANRVGAMKLQVYQTTNHVVTHLVDGASGVVLAIAMAALVGPLDVYAFPIAMIAAYLGVHAWVSSIHLYRSVGLSRARYLGDFVLPPAVVLVVLTGLLVATR